MRIKSISICGFRGFRDKCDLLFDERLTLIAAQNSYGKTSISEAFEWLLYGQTSKVEKADSKDEYKGSYRNCHLPPNEHPRVIVTLDDNGNVNTLEAELVEDDIRRKFNGALVSDWPFSAALADVPRPFILQHALKYLLLAKPVDRFTDFARLLGFEELGDLRKEVIALCTQYHLPPQVAQLVSSIDALQLRVQAQPALAQVARELKRGAKRFKQAYELIEKECARKLPNGNDATSYLAQLVTMRQEALGKIFRGSVSLLPYTPQEQAADSSDENVLLNGISEEVCQPYSTLITLKAQRSISDLAAFYKLGVKLLGPEPKRCPLCGQEISAEVREHVVHKHAELLEKTKALDDIGMHVAGLQQRIQHLRSRLHALFTRDFARASTLIAAEASMPQIQMLLADKHPDHYGGIRDALETIKKAKTRCDEALAAALKSLISVSQSLEDSTENLPVLTRAGERLVDAVAAAREYRAILGQKEQELSVSEEILKRELDALVGMREVSILIELLERRGDIEKRFRIGEIVDGLKDLRSKAEEFVGARMLAAISGEFTEEVMQWYGKIRTTGDPNVHFAGFDMKKIASGNRVQIKAKSYGRDLVSAVSSLSESKLNALGLCISIAINLNAATPFEFLLVDDPIQSWDQDHETKFIDVVLELVKKGKQVILLSHNQQWVRQVRSTCADLNGRYYQITGYTEKGPHIEEVQWAEAKQRLSVIDAILGNPDAGPVELQQAEEEIRIVVNQLAGELNLKKFGVHVNTKNMNAERVLKILLTCGVEKEFANKVVAVFETVDPAHHLQADYAVSRGRLREYHGRATSLADIVAKTVAAASKGTAAGKHA